jgi:effector-binding domain-containing protein
MRYDVRLDNIAIPRPTAVVRRTAVLRDLPKVIPEACGLVWNTLRGAGIRGGRNVALYLDDQFTLEIGVELDGAFAGEGEVVPSHLPAGRVAVATHLGPYPHLVEAHDAIQAWCAAHGHTLAGPCWELYAHWEADWEKNPAAIRTDVYYLLAQ